MTPHPHDALFKRAFSKPEHAAQLMRSVLPAPIVHAIDWASLRREPGSFIDRKLAFRHTDLLFSAQVRGERALMYVLAEHQSSSDRDMPLRMLQYMNRVWETFRRKQPKARLPVIVPLVVAHAPRRWDAPRSMAELFAPDVLEIEGLARHVPQFELFIDDLAVLSNEALRARALGAMPRLAVAMLRDARDGETLLANFALWANTVRELLSNPTGREDLRFLLAYVATISDLDIEAMRATIIEHVPEVEPTIMTLAERLIQQGREEGLDQGRVSMLINMLSLKFGPLDEPTTDRVRNASSEERDHIARRFVRADSLAAVFAD